MEWIRKLNEVSRSDVEQVGGKAAHLGELCQAGFNVPAGLVVTSAAFNQHFPQPQTMQTATRPQLTEVFSDALHLTIAQTFGAFSGTFAVRSSALGEDDKARSFAGQHDTYYFISPAGLDKALIDCWMSIWNPHALAYRTRMNLGPPSAMAVIIQPMVAATSSGVCFSDEPTGRFAGHGLIESTWGLGAALVDGRVSPDQFFVNENCVAHRKVARKRFRVATRPGSDRRLDPVPSHLQAVSSLTDDQILKIYEQSVKAAVHFECPQDVEWAFDEDRLYILQSRPITGSNTAHTTTPPGKWVIFKPMVENFHEPLTPMTADLLVKTLPSVGKMIDGRFYLNLALLRKVLPVKASESELADILLLRQSAAALPLAWTRVPGLVLAAVLTYLSTGILWHRTSRIEPQTLDQFRALVQGCRQATDLNALATFKRLLYGTGAIAPITSYMFQINVSAGRYFLYLSVLEQLISRFAPGFDMSKIGDLIRGDSDMLSSKMVRDLDHLKTLACEYDAIREAIEHRDPERLATEISTAPTEHPFIAALQQFLDCYGHRCIKEMELATPRWREEPAAVIGLLQAGLKSTNRPLDTRSMELAALDELHQQIGSRWKRSIIDRILQRIRYYVTLRENSRYYHTMVFDLVRQKLKLLERDLIYTGQLKCADDIFFLVWDEVEALQRGTLAGNDAGHLISTRRRHWVDAAKHYPRETLNIERPILREERDGRLLGQCASPGCVEGFVRIVLDPTMANDLGPQDILVAPYTDPAWTPLFPNVAAVVVGIGSFLSHAGTVAREFQIPCLVDVTACTDKLREGAHIRVNASEGYLQVLDS